MLEIGMKGIQTKVVSEKDTALYIGSGDLNVLATPAMIALMEETAWKSVEKELKNGETTVGTEIQVIHKKASLPGQKITAKSELVEVEERKLVFRVEVWDEKELIGNGIHTRYLINKERFLEKLN